MKTYFMKTYFKRALVLLVAPLMAMLLSSCEKDLTILPVEPTIEQEVTASGTFAVCSAKVTCPGNITVEVEWSLTPDMGNAQRQTMESDGGTFFTATMRGLSKKTTYYYRVTMTNRFQSLSSAVAQFTTLGSYVPEGAVSGLFSVSDSREVYFSQGNLQYQASTKTWRFAENQYDCVGSANLNISSSYSGWIDLFGWGTSGWNSGANCYQPWSTSTSNSDYYPGGSYTNNLTGSYANADWGVYNAISNGGNTANTWRTLTKDEWVYVFNTRTTSSGIRYAKACVNNVNGVILLPDDWSTSTYSLSGANSSGANFTANTITATQWVKLEDAGAVFLPAAGYRGEASVGSIGSWAFYWSASYSNESYAYGVSCNNLAWFSRYHGQSVRLVRSVTSNPSSVFTVDVSANPSNGGSVSGGGSYTEGQSCTVSATANSGYTFTNWTENGNVVSSNANYTFVVNADRTLVANFVAVSSWPNGVLPGAFSVSASQQVYFSQGNLQYQASTNTWRFAENQYDYIGDANSNISSSYSGWIDLFGWGTSGYNGKNPYMTNTYYSDYGNGSNDIAGTNYDWGVYNAISNGGNTANTWRTLTKDEWAYVFNTRTTSSGIRYAKACVNSVNGVILLPDDWNTSYYSLSSTNNTGASFASNTISVSQWDTLEQHGAVFLPAAGDRSGTWVSSVGSGGRYWSASYSNESYAYSVWFSGSYLSPQDGNDRYYGRSVRLVRSAQ